ncbi:MAG: hypothetical protein AUJ74_07575 [Candidatus Omnitrophica bacterium CG1_02_44_16]|nr:MAG: hypothetical protein AUJ74_07575 [Candidatus Omnitrophica bacterium CG1_02_44_16]PIY82908.1 MAG: DNA-binding protein [Candidatus Omnitrophica bacterium CG_4_10_14_0_8_um_filter_44_12]PIZ84384.1 MAG: DNA-binding protein [Candidatus Omnitrophica bacterium CG_4_10_14_0_2_um_filter_44_9]
MKSIRKNGNKKKEEDVLYWIKLSDYDIDTAEAMLRTGRYVYVLFCCQQAVEKLLKSIVVKVMNIFPPKSHDLIRLADLAKVGLSDEQGLFFEKLTNYYIETRYPEEMKELSQKVTKELAIRYFKETQEALKCLNQLLK